MALPALQKGSSILQVSECREGIGSKAFKNLLDIYNNDWKKFLKDIEADIGNTKLDQWEFQMLCRVLDITDIDRLLFLSEGIPRDEQKQLCCTPVETDGNISQSIESFIYQYAADNIDAKIAVIPSGPYTIIRNRKQGN